MRRTGRISTWLAYGGESMLADFLGVLDRLTTLDGSWISILAMMASIRCSTVTNPLAAC